MSEERVTKVEHKGPSVSGPCPLLADPAEPDSLLQSPQETSKRLGGLAVV